MNIDWRRHLGTACLLLALGSGASAQQQLIQIDPNQVTVTNTQVNNNLQQPQPGPKIDTTTPKDSYNQQQIPTGYLTPLGRPLCGGIVNGKLQPSCGYASARLIGKARKDCPAGSFFDVGTWSCYTCPAGYNRTGNHVDQWDACSKDVPDQLSRATYEGKVQPAPAGAKLDPRNGGEYWSCPPGLDRTWAPVDAWDACGMIGKEPKPATFLKRACPKGWHDPRNGGECWSCPDGHTRTAAAVDQWNACVRSEDLKPATKQAALTCAAGDHFDFVDGGTCWRCPKDTTRTFMNVKGNEACDYQNVMRWEVPKRSVPGLFGLDGAEEIALEILAQPKKIDELIMQTAGQWKGNPQQWIAQEWTAIRKDPSQSATLNSALLLRAIDAAAVPKAKRTPAEARFVAAVEASIRDNKIFLADQAQQFYDNWVGKRTAEIAMMDEIARSQARLGKPPEPGDVVRNLVQGGATFGIMGMGLVGMAVPGAFANFSFVAPYAAATLTHTAEMVTATAKTAAALATGGVTTSGSSMLAVAAAAAGPLIIGTGAIIAITMSVDEQINAERVRISTRNNVETAQKPVDIGVLLQMKDGIKQLMYHWGVMTNAPSHPSAKFLGRVAAIAAEKGAGPVSFDIVSAANTCLQAAGTRLSLVACDRANPTRWISRQGALVPLGNEGMCLTATGPALAPCQAQQQLQQTWRLEPTGQIVSGTGLMLAAKAGAVVNVPVNPALPGGRWKAETK